MAKSKQLEVEPEPQQNDDDVWPEVLPPEGESTIGHERIRAAVRAVLDRKKAAKGLAGSGGNA
jgi:hypothetical protein